MDNPSDLSASSGAALERCDVMKLEGPDDLVTDIEDGLAGEAASNFNPLTSLP